MLNYVIGRDGQQAVSGLQQELQTNIDQQEQALQQVVRRLEQLRMRRKQLRPMNDKQYWLPLHVKASECWQVAPAKPALHVPHVWLLEVVQEICPVTHSAMPVHGVQLMSWPTYDAVVAPVAVHAPSLRLLPK